MSDSTDRSRLRTRFWRGRVAGGSLAASVLALTLVVVVSATPAQAEISRCSGPVYVAEGVTLRTCIDVTLEKGIAESWIYINSDGQYTINNIWVDTTIYRNQDHATGTCALYNTGATVYLCRAIANQVPGVQAWRAYSYVYLVDRTYMADAYSPTVYDT